MPIVTGTVIDGHVVLSGPLPEGASVTVLVTKTGIPLRLPGELLTELEVAMAEVERRGGERPPVPSPRLHRPLG